MTDLVKLGFSVDTGGLRKGERGLDNLTKAGGRADRGMKSFGLSLGAVGTAIAALGITSAARDLARYADVWTNIESQLKQVTDSEQELLAVRKELLQVSSETRTDLESTAKLYTTLDRATSRLGVTTQEQIGLTKTINQLFLASGASSEDAANAIRQLSQGLEAGALRGDEFNSVAENAPRIMDALGSSLKMTRGELREFAATGGITAEIVVNALREYSGEAQRAADLTSKTWAQSVVIANNNMIEFAGNSDVLSASLSYAGDVIVDVSRLLADNVQYAEAYLGRFGVWSDDIKQSSDIIGSSLTKIVNDSGEAFPILAKNTDTLFDQISDGFKNLPDNLRAIIKILGVELAFLVDIGSNYGKAFGQAIFADFQGLIKKAEVWGDQLADALNPFEDSMRDYDAELKAIEESTISSINSIFNAANDTAERSRRVRLDSISLILTEKQESERLYQTQVEGIKKSESATKDLNRVSNELFKNFEETNKAPKWISDYVEGIESTKVALEKFFDNDDVFGKTAFEDLNDRVVGWGDLTDEQIDRIDSAFADVWYNVLDGADDVFGSLISSFKRMIAEMLHQATTKPILLNVQAALSGGGGIGSILGGLGGGALEGAGNLSSLLGIGGSLTGLGSLIGGAGLGTFGSGLGASLGFLGTGQFGAMGSLFSGFASAGSVGGALGAALPIAGIAAIAGTVVSDVLGFGSNWKLAEQKVTVEIVGDDFSGEVTTREKRKKLFKNRYRTSSEDIADDAYDALFGDLADQIDMWGEKLGISQQKIDGFFDSFSQSLEFDTKDLSEEQIQQKIDQFVASTSNAMVEGVFGDFASGLEKQGESISQTVVRLISTFETFDAVAKQLGLNFDATGKEAITAASNLADMVGGISNLASMSSNLIGFADFGDRISMAIKGFSGVFGTEIDANMPQTKAAFFDLAQSLDLTTTAGQEAYATLLRISPAIGEYYDLQAQRDQEWFDLRVRLLRAQGKEEEALAMIRERTLEQTRDGLKWMTEEVMKAEELAQQREEAARIEAKQKDLQIQLLQLQGREEEALALSRQKQLDALEPALHATMQMIFTEQDLAKQRDLESQALSELYNTLVSNVNFAKSQVEKSRDAELERISLLENAARDRFDAEVNAINSAAQMQERIYSNQRSALQEQLNLVSSISSKYGAESRGVSAQQALLAAISGNFTPAQNIQSVGTNFGSATELRVAQAREAFALSEIGRLADEQESSLEKQLSGVDRQINAIQSSSDAQIAVLQKQLDEDLAAYQDQKDALNKQVDELLGIDRSVMSLEEATALFEKEQKALLDLDYENQLKAIEQRDSLLTTQQGALQVAMDQLSATHDLALSVNATNSYIKNRIDVPPPPPPENPEVKQMVSEIKMMRAEMQNNLRQVAENTSETASHTRNIEYSTLGA